jgi:hypothetical protein
LLPFIWDEIYLFLLWVWEKVTRTWKFSHNFFIIFDRSGCGDFYEDFLGED